MDVALPAPGAANSSTNSAESSSPSKTAFYIGRLRLSLTDRDKAIATIASWIENRSRAFVCLADAHCAVSSLSNAQLASAYESAGLVLGDGLPLIAMCRILKERRASRVRGADLMRALCSPSHDRGYRHFFLGGTERTLGCLTHKLRELNPRLDIAGFVSPPFRAPTEAETCELIQHINDTQPDILWIGLGAPKQEIWMAKHRAAIQAPVIVGVGAAFDFLSGAKKEAPRWIQRIGCEWLFRLSSEPSRLGPRYMRVVPSFIVLLFFAMIARFRQALLQSPLNQETPIG
jgi:N-acetylglucosaminyldiphosphoundecaprenol N-acetyl-beta-D-mannosaminyltransferase